MGKKVEHPLDILREELQQTNVALKCAYDKFNYVTEPELIEACIYEISALAYTVMVLMIELGISVEDITKELEKRHVIDHKVKQERMQ